MEQCRGIEFVLRGWTDDEVKSLPTYEVESARTIRDALRKIAGMMFMNERLQAVDELNCIPQTEQYKPLREFIKRAPPHQDHECVILHSKSGPTVLEKRGKQFGWKTVDEIAEISRQLDEAEKKRQENIVREMKSYKM
jgi:hypothetical protein